MATKFLNVLLEERTPEKEAVGFFGNWAKHSIETKKERYDWRYENSITSGKNPVDIDMDYSQWRTNNILSNYRETILYANEMNCHYNVTDQMHYDYLYYSIRKKKMKGVKETEEEKKSRKRKEELQTLVSNYYKYNIVRTKEALKILTAEQLEIIRNKNNKGGVK
jgi:hypothetical protein